MRTLSEDDILAISVAIREHNEEHFRICRFGTTDPDDLHEAIIFYRKFNEAMDESKSVVRKTVLVMLITGIAGILGVNIWSKIKAAIIP